MVRHLTQQGPKKGPDIPGAARGTITVNSHTHTHTHRGAQFFDMTHPVSLYR